jgi:hypothetical protein
MKKKAFAVVLLLCAVFLLFSCDGSMTENLDRLLGFADGNLYIDFGFVTATKSDVTETMNLISSGSVSTSTTDLTGKKTTAGNVEVVQTNDGKVDVKIGNIKLALDSDTLGEDFSFTSPIDDDKLATLNETFNKATSADKGKDALAAELKAIAEVEDQSSAKGTFALAAAIADYVAKGDTDLAQVTRDTLSDLAEMAADIANAETITMADVLSAQLIVGIASDAAIINQNLSLTPEESAKHTARIVDQTITLLAISSMGVGSLDVNTVEGLVNLLINEG